ncbi:MAG: hypothetical protein OXC93_03555 [Rhodospirillaceae bacterium]|nr:hypothetical protein [Rhodospirillaceae bacterium]
MFLELEANPSAPDLDVKAGFILVRRIRLGSVDARSVLDAVFEGHDMRIVDR